MCALTAGQRGRRVLVIEKSNKLGKKILMSGGGRCNFTNLYIEPDCFISANPHFCKSALSRYTQWDFIALVEQHGIAYHERKHGELFCDDSSKQILAMLVAECQQSGVKLLTDGDVSSVAAEPVGSNSDSSTGFVVKTARHDYHADSLVLATGGLSIPTLGGSGFGYDVARQLGMQVLPIRAGLVPFTFSGAVNELTSRLSGNAVKVQATTGGQSFIENMLFTHRGMSGPVMLQLSNYWHVGEPIAIDFFHDADLRSWLLQMKQQQPKSRLRGLLSQRLPRSLVLEFQALFWPDQADSGLANFPDSLLETIAAALTNWSLKPSGTEGYRTAEVTLGGIDTDAVSSKTMESKTCPGLYVVGELLDVTGHLGGFNFQWAWSSGAAAGTCV